MWICRLTLWLFLFPRRFVADRDWSEFDLREWSKSEYQWKNDPWEGYRDVVQPVDETVRTGKGDCDDYAAVVLSYLAVETDHRLKLVFMLSVSERVGHVIVYDEDAQTTYSSGLVKEESLASFKADSKYDLFVSRRVKE